MIKSVAMLTAYGVLLLMSAVSCASGEGEIEPVVNKPEVLVFASQEEQNEAAISIKNNCYSCHNPVASEEQQLAPTLLEVKTYYKAEYTTQEDFVSAMNSFVLAPTKENAIMEEAEQKYGVMPNMQYSKETVNTIVNYLYSYDIETENWLAQYYYLEQEGPVFEDGDYLGLGKHIATTSKQELGKNLKGKIKNEGTEAAVQFCQLNAIPILDSMSAVFSATISRVSDRNRNPNNRANAQETEYIKTYQVQIDAGEEMNPIVTETNDLATFYMPIVTNEMCLQCHGTSEDIDTDVLSKIDNLYPKDKAKGYGVNQIRGIWKIEIQKNPTL